MKDPLAVLAEYFGFKSFRPNQDAIVSALLGGRDVLAIMPTGAGKSLCYQVPALCLDGLTLVISPLISLMKDQVGALRQAGVRAAYLNSSLPSSERREILQAAYQGEYTLLYVAPERLDTPDFLDLCRERPPVLIAVDEAHCISQWGQDFRPSYMQISQFIASFERRPIVAALTATATGAVRDDIVTSLGLQDPLRVVASFDRPNLHFAVERPQDKDAALLRICREHEGKSGIVFCSTRKKVEEACEMLCSKGVKATRYHAGLGAEERRKNQDDFLFDRIPVIVATNAFGMGIDKSNVNYVVHYNMPMDIESYYQEAGRAGRDGEAADCILLYAGQDWHTCSFLISNGLKEAKDIDSETRDLLMKRAEERLSQMTYYSTTTDCLRHFLLNYLGEEAPLFCGHCSNCETEFEERDITQDAYKVLSCVYRIQERNSKVGKTFIVDILRGSKSERIRQRHFDELSTYALMKESSKGHVRFVLDTLVERGLLNMTGGDYPVVEFTNAGGSFLHNREELVVQVPKEREPRPAKKKKRAGAGASSRDERLFERLRAVRSKIAEEQNVPAYVVFSNATLSEMSRRKPHTFEELLGVSGVGEKKATKYGGRFLKELREWDEE